MPNRFISFILISLFSSLAVRAQTEAADSLWLHPDSSLTVNAPRSVHIPVGSRSALLSPPPFSPLSSAASVPVLSLSDPSFTPAMALPVAWSGGYMAATGTVSVFPGLMLMNSGDLSLHQQIGSFMISAGASANKYGYFMGVHTQYGIHGDITYRLSPFVSISAFASHYFGAPPLVSGGLPMPPAMLGYYAVPTIGAVVNYQAADRFGVELGVQTVQHVGSVRYEPEPVITPYFTTGRGKNRVQIGLPVGQILYGIIRRRHR